MATIKQYKLNPVIEITQEEYDAFDGKLGEYYYGADIDKQQQLGWKIYIGMFNGIIDNVQIDDYTNSKSYYYIFDNGLERFSVNTAGWYYGVWNYTEVTDLIDVDNFILELRMDTEQPDEWDETIMSQIGMSWTAPFTTELFNKAFTEYVEGGDVEEPTEPELPEEKPEHEEPKEVVWSIKKSTLVDIANAIRSKTGSTDPIKVSDLDDAVKSITGSGGGSGGSTSSVTLQDLLEGEW